MYLSRMSVSATPRTGLSFTISRPKLKPGQKIAWLALTGAGKNTIVKLLMRFYDIQQRFDFY